MEEMGKATRTYGLEIEKIAKTAESKITKDLSPFFDNLEDIEVFLSSIRQIKEEIIRSTSALKDSILTPNQEISNSTETLFHEIFKSNIEMISKLENKRVERKKIFIKIEELAKEEVKLYSKLQQTDKKKKSQRTSLTKKIEKIIAKRATLKPSYNKLNDDINKDWEDFRAKYSENFKLLENQENSRFQVTLDSLKTFRELFIGIANRILQGMQTPIRSFGQCQFVNITVGHIPLSFMKQELKEDDMDTTVQHLLKRFSIRYSDHAVDSIFSMCNKYRSFLEPFMAMKLEMYLDAIFEDRFNSQDWVDVKGYISEQLDHENCVRYFLGVINYKLQIYGNQREINSDAFYTLKDNMLTIITNILKGRSCLENCGLVLHSAARICLSGRPKKIGNQFLIEEFKGHFMCEYNTWRTFFVFRVNRKLLLQKLLTAKQIKKDGLNYFGIPEIDIKDPIISIDEYKKLYISEVIKAEESAKKQKDQHGIALKEISYYMTLTEVDGDLALVILVRLFKEFEVENTLCQQVYFSYKMCAQAILESRLKASKSQTRRHRIINSIQPINAVLLQIAEFLKGDSSFFEILRLDKRSREELKTELIGMILLDPLRKELTIEDHSRLHSIMIPREYFENFDLLEKSEIKVTRESEYIVKVDLQRTTRDPAQHYRLEKCLYNMLRVTENTVGYFQGLNFVALYLIDRYEDDRVVVAFLRHLCDNFFMKYFHVRDLKTGVGVLSLFHTLERLTELNCPSLYAVLQREGLTCQQFVASVIITLFTSSYSSGTKPPLIREIWDFVLAKEWEGFLQAFIYIVKTLESFLINCEMEDIIYFWDHLMKSKEFLMLQEYDPEPLKSFISDAKLSHYKPDRILDSLKNIKARYNEITVTEGGLDIFIEEYKSLNQTFKSILKGIEKAKP